LITSITINHLEEIEIPSIDILRNLSDVTHWLSVDYPIHTHSHSSFLYSININQLLLNFIVLYASMGWHIIFRRRPMSITSIKHRTLFGISPPKPAFPFGLQNKTQQYAEKRVLGYFIMNYNKF